MGSQFPRFRTRALKLTNILINTPLAFAISSCGVISNENCIKLRKHSFKKLHKFRLVLDGKLSQSATIRWYAQQVIPRKQLGTIPGVGTARPSDHAKFANALA